MSCLATICMYGALSLSAHNAEPVETTHTYEESTHQIHQSPYDGAVIYVPTTITLEERFESPQSLQMDNPVGEATLGLEHKSGLFLELGHRSSLSSGNDRGYEFVEVGVRKTFASW